MRKISLLLMMTMVALAGCDKLKVTPVSLQDTPLPGNWFGERQQQLGDVTTHDRLFLRVTESGYVDYHFLACESGAQQTQEKSMHLREIPIKRLTTVKMVLQAYPLTPKFELTLGLWPDQNAGVWEVDGVALHPVDDNNLPDPSQWRCASDESLQ